MKLPRRKKKQAPRRVIKSSDVKVNRYISPRKTRQNNEPNKRKASKRRRQFVRALVMVLVGLAVAYFLWVNSRVTEVRMQTEQQNYRATIEGYLARNPLANYKPFISSQALSDTLTQVYPEIEFVVVKLPFFGEAMEIEIVERQAQLVLRTADDEYFIVDSNGYAYDNYDPKLKNDKVVILKDDTEVAYDLDSNRFVPSAIVEFIEGADEALKGVKQYNGQTFSYRITDEARVLYVKPSKEPYEIKMQLDRSPQRQVASLTSALTFYATKKIKPTSYIDVRVNGTVYYK